MENKKAMKTQENLQQDTASSGDEVRVGTRIIKQLSTTFYPNPLIIFDELVANARDALAGTVRIKIGIDTIVFEDNGEGMTRDGLVRFFYISYTGKGDVKVRSFKNVKRFIIGRFGIGKLSLYQICRTFKIETWREGVLSKATFDFEEFENMEFVDDFHLEVKSEPTSLKDSGTRITLMNLKRITLQGKVLDAIIVKRQLVRTMPMTEDFKIVLEGTGLAHPVILKSEDLVHGNTHIIEKIVPGVGEVKGRVIYKPTQTGDSGVFVRVFERLVNIDHPNSMINFASLNHAEMYNKKIYAEFSVNDLDEALQTNRSGFIANNPKYEAFIVWLKSMLNELNEKEYKKWLEVRENVRTTLIPDAVSSALSAAALKTSLVHKPETRAQRISSQTVVKSSQTAASKKNSVSRDTTRKSGLLNAIMKGSLKIETHALGEFEPEAVFDQDTKVLRINSSSAGYRFAWSQSKLHGLVYHTFKASVVLIAMESASDLQTFKHVYDELVRDPEVLDMLNQKWSRIGFGLNQK